MPFAQLRFSLLCAPMTYEAGAKQYVVVAIGGLDADAELIALSLPERD